jgi:hypothetical protein
MKAEVSEKAARVAHQRTSDLCRTLANSILTAPRCLNNSMLSEQVAALRKHLNDNFLPTGEVHPDADLEQKLARFAADEAAKDFMQKGVVPSDDDSAEAQFMSRK